MIQTKKAVAIWVYWPDFNQSNKTIEVFFNIINILI